MSKKKIKINQDFLESIYDLNVDDAKQQIILMTQLHVKQQKQKPMPRKTQEIAQLVSTDDEDNNVEVVDGGINLTKMDNVEILKTHGKLRKLPFPLNLNPSIWSSDDKNLYIQPSLAKKAMFKVATLKAFEVEPNNYIAQKKDVI